MRGLSRLATFVILLTIALSPSSLGGGGPKNVLLVINDSSPVSQSIGAYYQQRRGIPNRNVCHISCSTAEFVSKTECENNIVIPIRNYINNSGIHERIDYIVLTKGIPLGASYNDSAYYGPLSTASLITCVGEPSVVPVPTNPYGPTASPAAPQQYFTHQLSFSGKSYYAVARLDAYTEDQVHRMIDDSLAAQSESDLFVLDGCYWTSATYIAANNRLRTANHNLLTAGKTTYYNDTTFDSMVNEFVGGQQGVMGYFSWGSNESAYYTLQLYKSNVFLPGSIADTYTSTSSRTFTYPPTYGQSLIADLIPQGLSAGNGYVSEPYVNLATFPNFLFDRYIQGYNVAESFLAATPKLYWKAVLVGDPLMAPYATPPSVSITIQRPQPEHGRVIISANAADDSGINKVKFYVDDNFMTTCFVPPYQFEWDTMAAGDGSHLIEAVAYENTSVYTQGMASVTVQVSNVPQDFETISQLESVAIGALIRLTSKPVIAGTDAFSDCIYLSEPDRSAGMKVTGALGVPTGSHCTVVGELSIVDGERVIVADSWSTGGMLQGKLLEAGTGGISPLAMPNRFVANSGSKSGQESHLILGLSNTGLLIRTWGRVVSQGLGEFSISDGSLRFNNPGFQDVVVSLKNLAAPLDMPPLNSYVVITGVSCYTLQGDQLKQTIRPRSPDDIVIESAD